jgi:2-polyprenyl-6-methoxyphenol hydroxylase-like FAD-dependent oxidoreductase
MILDLDYSRLSPELRGYGISRNALFSALFGALSRCGGSALELHTNATVKAVSPSGEVTLTDGRTGRFDLVLVADGAHSSLRRFISSVRRDAIYPWGCLWANISLPSPLAPDTLHQRCLSTRVMVGVLPIGRLEDAKATQAAALFWSLRNDTADQVRSAPFSKLRDEIVSLWPELAESLAGLHNGHADFVHATYRDVWVDPPFSGRMLFIGDAGHGTSPQLGQGANLALEDAVTLGMALEGATEDTLPQRLKSYWRARRDPLLYYRRASWLLTPFFQSDMRLLGFLRDTFAPLGRLRFVDYLNVTTLAGIRTGFLPGRVRADPDAACLWLEK